MRTQTLVRKSVPVTVNVSTGGEYVGGVFVPAAKQSYERMMVSVPVTMEDRKFFERETLTDHGSISIDDVKFYDYAMDLSIRRGDTIAINGRNHTVLMVLDRSVYGYKVYYGKTA